RITVDERSFDVRVPRGIRPGQVIRLGGQGAHGGDLLLEIEYAAHPQFEVDGRNSIHNLPVAPWEAALGATVSAPTLGGRVELKIPAGSKADRKLRLRDRGLPGPGGAAAGDQLVEIEIQAPVPQDARQREAYEKLRESFPGDWREGRWRWLLPPLAGEGAAGAGLKASASAWACWGSLRSLQPIGAARPAIRVGASGSAHK